MLKLALEHFPPSLILGIIFGLYFEERGLIIIALLTGWLIDIDHILDYFKAWKTNAFSKEALEGISSGKYFLVNSKAYIVLHAWEWIIIWFLAWSIIGRLDVGLTGATAWAIHLFIDHLSYKLHWYAYFITYRLLKGFDLRVVCKH